MNAHNNNIRKIVIVGGGSAGWMTAAALSSLLSPPSVEIVLIESEQIGTIGVGEATIPDVINFNAMLGVREQEFLQATNGTFKLGIQFDDWGRIGDSYFHPFGLHGADMQGVDFHQFWMRYLDKEPESVIEDFSLCAHASRLNKFALPASDPRSVLSQIRYAYHFEASGYAKFLRGYAESRGVRRVEGKIVSTKLAPENGFIENVQLESGDKVEGDLFFDCTGFRAVLMEEALGVPFIDWKHWLPCNTAQTIACEQAGDLLPFTISTAKSSGWQWRIPTQTRTGNGHIYSSNYMTDDDAIESLLSSLDGAAIGEPRKIRFRTGHRQTFWEKNCVAVGLSGGFLEPLESTSLFLIQEAVSKLIAMFPTRDMPEIVRREYNNQLTKKFEQVRDFIILHYKATERSDSPFWDYCRTMEVPDSLQHKMELFRSAGRVFRHEDELFGKTSWIAVFLGQGVRPKSVDPIVSSIRPEQIAKSLESMRSAMTNAAEQMPKHEVFLKQYAWARDVA